MVEETFVTVSQLLWNLKASRLSSSLSPSLAAMSGYRSCGSFTLCQKMTKILKTLVYLRLANIIVQVDATGEIDVSGIIDWESSGFYPSFWEAAKLTNCMSPHETDDWFLHLPEAISPLRFPKSWLLNLVWDRHVD